MTEGVDGLTRDKTRKPANPLPPATVHWVVDLALGPAEAAWDLRVQGSACMLGEFPIV